MDHDALVLLDIEIIKAYLNELRGGAAAISRCIGSNEDFIATGEICYLSCACAADFARGKGSGNRPVIAKGSNLSGVVTADVHDAEVFPTCQEKGEEYDSKYNALEGAELHCVTPAMKKGFA